MASFNRAAGHVAAKRHDRDEVSVKADVLIADLMYECDGPLVDHLNDYLEQKEARFGGYNYFSDAAAELRSLTAIDPDQAKELKGYLDSFAQQHGFSVEAFVEWRYVVCAKDRRRGVANPLTRTDDLAFLDGLVEDPNSCIEGYKNAVAALLVMARTHFAK